MPRHPEGSAKRHRGRWTARVTWGDPSVCQCEDTVSVHATDKPHGCTLCPCAKFTPKRREWRRVADPNRKDIALELAHAQAKKIRSGEFTDAAPNYVPRPNASPTFAEVARRFAKEHCVPPRYENGVKLSGMQDHRGVQAIIDKILVPSALGPMPIKDITFPDVETLRNARLTAPKLRGGKTVVETTGSRSIARVNREMSVARQVFGFAVELRYIDRSPMQAIGRRRSLVVASAEKARDRVLTYAEERAMLAVYSARSVDYFLFALDTGMRESEVRGLEVRDVDIDAGLIYVRWEIAKTKKARTLPMTNRVRAILQKRCLALRNEPAAVLFGDVSDTLVREDFIAAKAAANVTDFQMRDCRATLSTRLKQLGMDRGDVARITGHRINRQTGDAPVLDKHYIRDGAEVLAQAASLLNAAVANTLN